MGATRTSTLSTGVEVSSNDPEESMSSSYSSQTGVYLGTLPGEGSLAADIYGSASAYGTDTFAELDIDAQLSESGFQADIGAYSVAQGGDNPYAVSVGAINLYGSAEVYLGITQQSMATETSSNGSTVAASYQQTVSAVSLGGETAEYTQALTTPPEMSAEIPPYLESVPDVCGCDPADSSSHTIDGNLAIYEVSAVSYGDSSHVSLMLDAIVVEDAFSDVTAVVFLVI